MTAALDVSSLYQAHARVVWRTLLRLGVPAAHIEDTVQEVFLAAHTRRIAFEQRSTPLTWLLGIAIRVAANVRRANARNVVDVGAQLPDPKPLADSKLEQHQQLAALNRVLNQLPDDQREVVVLVDLEQLSAPEAADIVGAKVNTVYSRLRLGRAALSRLLTAEADHA